MRRWFHGKLRGHYFGLPNSRATGLVSGGSEAFSITIYQAVISDMQHIADVAEPEPLPEPATEATSSSDAGEAPLPSEPPPAPERHHHLPAGDSLHQAHIEKVHFLNALGPGRTVRGAAFDVLAGDLSFSHPARHGTKVYGRVEGTVSGWFRPPPEPAGPEETPPPITPPGIVWSSAEVTAAAADPIVRAADRAERLEAVAALSAPSSDRAAGAFAVTSTSLAAESGATSPLDSPAVEGAPAEEPGKQPPFFAFFVLVAIVLLFTAPPYSALIWALCFLPSFGLRKWLLGTIPDTPAVALFSYFLGFADLLLGLSLVANFYALGCRALSVGPQLGLVFATILSAVLPRSIAFALCAAAQALVLIAYYGRFGLPYCG